MNLQQLDINLFDLPSFSQHENWLAWLDHKMLPRPKLESDFLRVIDLFAGCGGLALGFETEGFKTWGYEMKPSAVETYNFNLAGTCIKQFLSVGQDLPETDVIIGGPPCQPFSQIGYQRGKRDHRDGIPIFIDAVKNINPKLAIIENVKGLMYRNKAYLRQVVFELESLGYCVYIKIINSLEYGVPQKRERIIIVASKIGWEWPEAFVTSPVTTGIAFGSLAFEHNEDSHFLTPKMDQYIAEYERKSQCARPRDLYLDKPSRTVTCRNLGGATSDMLRIKLPDGRRRMLTIREAARLQGFPDWFQFRGNLYERYEQIGNALPPLVAKALAQKVKLLLVKSSNKPLIKKYNIPIMNNIEIKKDQALDIIQSVGIPLRGMTKRRKERIALALIAVAQIKPGQEWKDAKSYFTDQSKPLTTREIIRFWNNYYGEKIADSSYDDVRRKDLIYLLEAGLVQNSAAKLDADTNDGTRGYSITALALSMLHAYDSSAWDEKLKNFRVKVGSLADRLSRSREFQMIPIILPTGEELELSPGSHNKIQKAIVEEFLPRFVKGDRDRLLYIGDTKKKNLYQNTQKIISLGLPEPQRDMLPDILAYDEERNWLFIIEAVHSSNPSVRGQKL
jgi:site-specific DNA-cytosine methylase